MPASTGQGPLNKPTTIVAAIVALIFFVAAIIAGISISGHLDSTSVPLVTAMLALVGTTVPGLLALYKSEQNHQELRNGLLIDKVTDALNIHDAETGAQTVVAKVDPSGVTDDHTPDYVNNGVKEGE